MTCPHSAFGAPETCSQCMRATPRRVDIAAGVILIDGAPERANEEPVTAQVESARRRR